MSKVLFALAALAFAGCRVEESSPIASEAEKVDTLGYFHEWFSVGGTDPLTVKYHFLRIAWNLPQGRADTTGEVLTIDNVSYANDSIAMKIGDGKTLVFRTGDCFHFQAWSDAGLGCLDGEYQRFPLPVPSIVPTDP